MAAPHLRTYARLYTFLAAAVLILIGLLGFVLPGPRVDPRTLILYANAHYLFGVFPVNGIDNVHYILVGLIGLGMGTWPDYAGPRMYARGLTVWYGLLGLLGFVKVLNSVIFVMPIWGWDVALHLTIASVALFMGYWPFWLPNEAYDEGDADESGRPGVPKRPGTSIHSSGGVSLDRPTPPARPPAPARPPTRPAVRPAADANGDGAAKPKYRPPRFDGQGNPIP